MVEHVERADAGLTVWRDAPSLDGARTAALGAFSCADAPAGARLLRATAANLAAEGFAALIGPMDGDTWSAHRLVIESDGSAPFLMEPQNPSHFPEAFDAAGFAIVARYCSAERPGDAPIEASPLAAGITLRAFKSGDAEGELARIHALSLRAFADNAFYKPISAEHFIGLYLPIVPLLEPELVLMAEDAQGQLVGFLFAIPDFAEGDAPRSVILKTYASLQKGVGGALARVFHERVRERGFSRVIHALMHESNLSARHSGNLNARVFRRYGLWAKLL
jgi:hypothetical protein